MRQSRVGVGDNEADQGGCDWERRDERWAGGADPSCNADWRRGGFRQGCYDAVKSHYRLQRRHAAAYRVFPPTWHASPHCQQPHVHVLSLPSLLTFYCFIVLLFIPVGRMRRY